MLISQLQKFEPTDWSGLTTENHIGSLYGLDPILISSMVDKIYEVNHGTDIDRFMDQFPVLEIEDDRPFEWLLEGSDWKNMPIVEAYDDPSGSLSAKPGIGGSRFYVVIPERWFEITDVLGTEDKENYQLRVVAEPRVKGANFEYEVELLSGDLNAFVPVSLLQSGKRLVKLFSAVEQTLSKRGGGVNHTSPFRMQNRCSMIRAQYQVPGNMINKGQNSPLAFYFKDSNGKVQTTWIGKLDYDFMVQFKRQKALMLMYGKSNKNEQGTFSTKGESGYELKMGSGLYEQISPSNIFYYNSFNIDVLGDILMSLSVGKLPEDKRKFVLGTGEYGMRQFHKAVESYANASFTPNRTETRFAGSRNEMTYGGQFVGIAYIQGIEVSLMHIPFLDDPALNPTPHPDGGLMSSYEYLILDFGTSKGQPNIQKVHVKNNTEILRYIPGMRDPFSPYNNLTKPGTAASSVDGYEVHKMYIGGIKVHNPLRMARLLPNFK